MESEKKFMHKNILDFEPADALFVSNNNPLVFYESIIKFCNINLKYGGFIVVEINEKLYNKTSELFENNYFSKIKLHKDINDKYRFISAIKK